MNKQFLPSLITFFLVAIFCPFNAESKKKDVSNHPTADEIIKAEFTLTPQKSGGVYFAYPVSESKNTTPPAGYEPFYISHYARHGSRYLISDNDYEWLINLFDAARQANALTDSGLSVAERLDSVWQEAELRGGDLTPLGQRQHYSIGRRMAKAFPEVFAPGAQVDAKSTVVMRCSLSMGACVDGVTSEAPWLFVPKESSEHNMYYLNYHDEPSRKFTSQDSEWRGAYNQFREAHTDGTRIADLLFKSSDFKEKNVDANRLLEGLYWVAVDMQNAETPVDFFDIFTIEELYDQWLCQNLNFYICDSNYAGSNGMLLNNARPLISNILQGAQQAISSGSHGASLRFGHDGNIIPLAGKLGLEGCYGSVMDFDSVPGVFRVHEIAPMAANVQIVFFRNPKNPESDILVKFMLNETETSIPISTDIFPFYRWNDVEPYLKSLITG